MASLRPAYGRLPAVIARHALASADPHMAALLGHVLSDYLVDRKGYDSAAKSYVDFCTLRGLSPWPTDGVLLGAWLLRICTHVRYTSMKVYLAAVHYRQVLEGFRWEVQDYEYVRRALRWIRRKLPCDPKGAKFAVTLSLLRALLPLLPGWPHLSAMSHDDRLFAAASWIAVTAFLRGGEFMSSPGSKRPLLLHSAMEVRMLKGVPALVVAVPQPKATCWLPAVEVPCYGAPPDVCNVFCAVKLWRAYAAGSPPSGLPPESTPAFRRANGSPLSRAWMIQRIEALCKLASIPLLDENGKGLPLKMASFRAGAVRSAVAAGLSEPMIMELGRWRSSAWRSYLLHTALDVQGAARRMLAASEVEVDSLPMVVGSEIGSSPQEMARDEVVVGLVQASCRSRARVVPVSAVHAVRSSSRKRPAVSAVRSSSRKRRPYHFPSRGF